MPATLASPPDWWAITNRVANRRRPNSAARVGKGAPSAAAREEAPSVALPGVVEAALAACAAAAKEVRLRESVGRAVRAAIDGIDWDQAVADATAPPKPLHEMTADEFRQYAASDQARAFRSRAVREMAPAVGRSVTETDAEPAEPSTPLHQMGDEQRHAHSAAAWEATTRNHASPFWRGARTRTIGQPIADASSGAAR